MVEEKFDKKVFKNLVESMLKGFDKETMSSGLYQHFLDNAEWFKEPDSINSFILYPVRRATEVIIQNIHKKSGVVASIWVEYGFIENNISKLCEQFYGSACCVDRGRFITNSFIKFKETGKMPKFDWKQEYTYHYPKIGTMKEWLDFAEGVYELRYGINKKYLKALMQLMKVHKKCVIAQNECRKDGNPEQEIK